MEHTTRSLAVLPWDQHRGRMTGADHVSFMIQILGEASLGCSYVSFVQIPATAQKMSPVLQIWLWKDETALVTPACWAVGTRRAADVYRHSVTLGAGVGVPGVTSHSWSCVKCRQSAAEGQELPQLPKLPTVSPRYPCWASVQRGKGTVGCFPVVQTLSYTVTSF